jgi:hypothetical protein
VSQVATTKKLVLRDERVKVSAHFREQGSILQGTKEGFCEGFEIQLLIESDESPQEIAELARIAHRMCFTEAALGSSVAITTINILNGEVLG